MRRLTACVAGLLSALALTGCDPQSDGGAKAAAADAPAALSAPAPERFAAARSGGGGLDLAEANAPARAAFERTGLSRAASSGGGAAAPASNEDAAARASAAFDNARLASATAAPPARARRPSGALHLADRRMAIDTDGWIADPAERRRVVSHDRWHRDGTALTVAGRALDATQVPYISIPLDFKGARVGDLAQVCYGARCAYAVVGDLGPKGRFGEGSVALARELGINPDGNAGGASSGVSYTLFPGSRGARKSQAELVADIRSRGPVLAQAAGAPSAIQLASL